MDTSYSLAVLTSHPIQYQAPLFKKLSKKTNLTVYFCWNFGIGQTEYDSEFGKKIKWDIPLLEGYKYKFLRNYSLNHSTNFWGQINFGIIKEIISGRYDAILIFGWNSFTNWLAFIASFMTKTPVLLRAESPLNQELAKKRWKIFLKKLILGNLFRKISAFLYIGQENKEFYEFYGVPDKKLFFAPYAIDNERFMKEAAIIERQKIRSELGIREYDFAILFVGKLIHKKRPMDLVLSYQQLIIRNQRLKNKLHLVCVGDGALRQELENYVKNNNVENVHFVGFKNQTELPEYYALADLFVLPSGDGETWGLVVNEAMCFGLPVIISNIVGCGADLIKEGQNGYIFAIGDVYGLAQKMENLLIHDRVLKRFREKSLEIIKDYSFDTDVLGILAAIKDL